MIEQEEVTILREQGDLDTSRALVPIQQWQVVEEIVDPEVLVGSLIRNIFQSDQLLGQEKAELAVSIIPSLVQKIQCNTIGLGLIFYELRNEWYNHYRDYLLDAGPLKRDGFYHYMEDHQGLHSEYVNTVIRNFEDWARVRKIGVQGALLVEKPLHPAVSQIVSSMIVDMEKSIKLVNADTRYTETEREEKVADIVETARERVTNTIAAPVGTVIQERKQEKGTPDRLHITWTGVRYSENQDEVVGLLSIRSQGEHSTPDILKEMHTLLKERTHVEVELADHHMPLKDLDALANHMNAQLEEDNDLYFDEDEEEDEEDEEEEYEEL